MTIDDERLIFDFTESDPRARGAVNGTLPTTTSGVIVALKCVFSELEMCGGLNRAIDIKTTPDSIFTHSGRPPPPG